ncbi:SH3 domain-containing protein Dlish [Acropora cervicornis]|uniref:SH3 domain-containing protein Dlish n=1 Tax=Acropora cervicornis TaxID=6130 RepID=A0AAD9QB62_ACRCE|nr:SH3 domain-containing protein Dlish [Acropora cervicornis]
MAFFCPMRIIPRRRRKRYRDEKDKKGTQNGNSDGRITGRNSEDSLNEPSKEEEDAEVEFEPRKMVVLHDFIPCVEDEVAVKRGQHVKSLYQETDWIYIVTNDGKEGFIPFTYCVAEEEYEKRKEKQKAFQRNNIRNASFLDSLQVQTDMFAPAFNFKKNNYGDFIVRFEFIACDENDINAQKGDKVTVLNKDDKDWYWVVNTRGVEGFIPKDFLVPFDRLRNGDSSQISSQIILNGGQNSPVIPLSPSSTQSGSPCTDETSTDLSASSSGSSIAAEPYYFGTSLSCQNQPSSVTPNSQRKTNLKRRNTNELLLYGHELVCIDTYVGKKVDELTVHKGDWIYADMKLKDSRGWIWAYSPANKLQGYVPRSCVRPPATTPL